MCPKDFEFSLTLIGETDNQNHSLLQCGWQDNGNVPWYVNNSVSGIMEVLQNNNNKRTGHQTLDQTRMYVRVKPAYGSVYRQSVTDQKVMTIKKVNTSTIHD